MSARLMRVGGAWVGRGRTGGTECGNLGGGAKWDGRLADGWDQIGWDGWEEVG